MLFWAYGSTEPYRYRVVKPATTFRNVKWHPTEPAEDFSFFDNQLLRRDGPPVPGKIHFPHPATKPAHFQKPDALELVLPFLSGLKYGDQIELSMPAE